MVISSTQLLVAAGLWLSVEDERRASPAAGLWTGRVVEVMPSPPRGALEEELSGPLVDLYARAMQAIHAGQDRDALLFVRQARGQAYQERQRSAASLAAFRHFVRVSYAEELISDSVAVERALSRRRESLTPEEQVGYLSDRALYSHNKFLLVRSFLGRADARLLQQAQQQYEAIMARPGPLRPLVLVQYAALQAERGDRQGAQSTLARLSADELSAEAQDLAVAYYHLAQGDRRRAMARLQIASQREAWDRPTNARDGRTLRALVYRMNDFDGLRDHPLFQVLVTLPEEAAARQDTPPARAPY